MGLSSCGGGGGGGNGGIGPVGQVNIAAIVLGFPTGATPPGFASGQNNTGAIVEVFNQAGTAPITDATVTINGVVLPYVAARQDYEGEFTINPGAQVSFSVRIGSATYSSSHRQFSTYPTIVVPAANSTWSSQNSNLVSWSGAAPNSTSRYALGIIDTDGFLVWPSGSLLDLPITVSDFTIPAGSLNGGDRLVLVGVIDVFAVAGATADSGLLLGGFNYTPVTVAGPGQTLMSVTTSPPSATLGVNKSGQLAATGRYADNSIRDITTQATWSSTDTAIVTVSATGLITGINPGAATVTAQLDGLSDSTTVTVIQPNPSPAPPLSSSVAYQIDYAHSGRAVFGGSGPVLPPSANWSTTLNGIISYPVIADGKVYVTTNVDVSGANYGTSLYALDLATGNVAWGPISIAATFAAWSGHTYDHGRLFVVNYDGLLRSFNAATGAPGWSTQLYQQNAYTAPPTAVNGIVYVGGGGRVHAVDETTGDLLWWVPVSGGDKSSPTVSDDGVFVSYPCQVYKLDPQTGTTLWHYAGPCVGGGGKTSVYANGKLFVRDPSINPPNPIFDAGTGTVLGSFSATVAPAFSGQTGFFRSGDTLRAIDQVSGNTLWTFMGDGGLMSAPIVIDDVVAIGSFTGTVYALNAANGNVIWSGSAGAPIEFPDEQNVSRPTTGFGVGEGYLVVPASNVLTGWRLTP
ncbi:MAG: PQQ-binding-like beta-propeller repeat protein [Steroidobacteraceae bacterium]